MRKCNKLFRITVLLLLMSIILSSCASGAADTDDTTVSSDVTTGGIYADDKLSELYRDEEDSLPELDFDGATIRFLILQNRTSVTGNVYDDEILVEELTSEPLNDSIYNRNMYVMERLNCKIENVRAVAANIHDEIEKTFGADEDIYQVIGFEAAPALRFGLDGYFYDINSIEDNYIDFDAPWWTGQFFDAVSAHGKVPVLAGSLSLSMIRSIHATYFNKRIAEDHKIEDLYNVVSEGRWTIDYQTELTSGMYIDVNGNDLRDTEDWYGYCSPFYWSSDSYWSAFDIDILSRNEEDKFEFVLNEEKAYNGLHKIIDLCYGPGAYSDAGSDETNQLFVSGNVFMVTQKLSSAELPEFRNMQDDYGLIPMPKYDNNQKEYYSMPYEIFQTYSVPKTNVNPGMATAVLEALCAETWRKVIPTYSEMVLKGKYLSDSQSRQMFDTIINSIKVDAGVFYYLKLGDIASALYRYRVSDNEPEGFTASLEKAKRFMNIYINELNNALFES